MNELKKGDIITHYKKPNKRYEVLEIGFDSNTMQEMIVYKALYQGEFKFGTIWIRPKKEFFDIIEFNGIKNQRFKKVLE